MTRFRHLLVVSALSLLVLLPATASADMVGVYARGHGSYLIGDREKMQWFENNDAGFGYGFAVGAELLQIDLFLDANFHPQGSAWNQLGIGFDMDVLPGPLFLEPGAQLVYFFAKQHDGTTGAKGLWPRVGAQFGGQVAKVVYFGVEGWLGYSVSLPEADGGFTTIIALFAGLRFKAL